MPAKKFQRNIENFTCEHCGAFVKGNGYTNHCPRCLWSKHVDVHPGDRENSCQGLMKPTDIEVEGNEYILIHRCQICGVLKRNRTSTQDDFEDIIKLSTKNI